MATQIGMLTISLFVCYTCLMLSIVCLLYMFAVVVCSLKYHYCTYMHICVVVCVHVHILCLYIRSLCCNYHIIHM